MEKKMRVDKKKNLEKIAKVVVKNPRATEREIAKATGLWNWTINRLKQEVEQIGAKDDRILTLTNTDFDIVILAQQRIQEKLADEAEMKKTRIGEISNVAKDSAARYTVFRWAVTDENGAMKDLTSLSIQQLEEHRRLLLGN